MPTGESSSEALGERNHAPMDAQITRLLEALSQARYSSPDNVAAFLQNLPDAGTLPLPWETWTLIGLVRHRDRQYWLRDVIKSHLRAEPAEIAAMGALGHPSDVKQSGSVPGMPEWEYFFHGCGCCLTQKVTGESIDVDFSDETAEHFDVFFYTNYLESLRNPEAPELRLLELHRSIHPIKIAVNHLLESGAMNRNLNLRSQAPRISEEVLSSVEAVEAFCVAWNDSAKRVWLAGIIGDWLAADEAAAAQPEVQRITKPRAEKCLAMRRQLLLQASGYEAADALYGLVEAGGADDQVEAALLGSPSGVVSAALEIVTQQDNPKWCARIYSLFKRVRPFGPLPEPHLWMNSLKFLLRHGHQQDIMIASLTKSGGTELGEGILLALEYAPEHAIPLIRRGLLSDIPCNRTTVAAVLALIDEPWSLSELLRALEWSNEQAKTADVRAALLETGNPDAEQAVLAWEQRNPHENEAGHYLDVDGRKLGPFYSMDEHMLKSRASFVRYEMNSLHERVMKIKDVIPPEPRDLKPWWKRWGR